MPPRLPQLLLLGLLLAGPGATRAEAGPAQHRGEYVVSDAAARAEDILARGAGAGFAPFGRWTPNLGFLRPDQAVWVRLVLEGEPDADTFRAVELGIARLLHVDWHIVASGKVISVSRSGVADIPPTEIAAQRKPWALVPIPRGESRTVLLRIASDTAVWLPLRAGTPGEREGWAMARTMADFTLLGACLGIALLNLLMGGITRNSVYLAAGILPLANIAYQSVFLGYHQAIFPHLPRWVSKEGVLLLAAVLGIGLFAFTHRLLGSPGSRGTWGPRFAIAAGLSTLPVILLLPFPIGSQLTNLLLVIGSILCVWGATFNLRGGPRAEGWLLLVGWTLPLASGLMLLAQLGGHAPGWFDPTAIIRAILPGTFILFVLAAMRSQRRLREAEVSLDAARRRQEEARLEALRHQLNPHLAFNTLASIETLSREAPGRIPPLVNRLAAFLRHRMAPSGRTFHSLGEELEAAQAYLDIERSHLEERLQVECRVPPETLGLRVPEFTLQPLVENAVKHGLSENERVTVRIEAELADGSLRLRVGNTGRIRPRRASLRGEGIGLENLRQRLALHLGERARATLREGDGWVVAEVDLPAQPLSDLP